MRHFTIHHDGVAIPLPGGTGYGPARPDGAP